MLSGDCHSFPACGNKVQNASLNCAKWCTVAGECDAAAFKAPDPASLGAVDLNDLDESFSATLSLEFDFPFPDSNGEFATYTAFSISSNGYIALGGACQNGNDFLVSPEAFKDFTCPVIAPLW